MPHPPGELAFFPLPGILTSSHTSGGDSGLAKTILSGHIVVPAKDLSGVLAALPTHIELTRKEPGCLEFRVERDGQRADIFHVYEEFVDCAAFEAHQARIAGTAWQEASAHVERHYTVREEQ